MNNKPEAIVAVIEHINPYNGHALAVVPGEARSIQLCVRKRVKLDVKVLRLAYEPDPVAEMPPQGTKVAIRDTVDYGGRSLEGGVWCELDHFELWAEKAQKAEVKAERTLAQKAEEEALKKAKRDEARQASQKPSKKGKNKGKKSKAA